MSRPSIPLRPARDTAPPALNDLGNSARPRFVVVDEGLTSAGVPFWSIRDARNGRARETWTALGLCLERCAWLNTYRREVPDTAADAVALVREAGR
jgi:hypothetical protein